MVTNTDTQEITNTADVLDVRDIIARFEFLAAGGDVDQDADSEDQRELVVLTELLADLKGNGDDEEWKDAWYPLTLVRDSYFEEFAQEEAESLGLIPSDLSWPFTCIDWEAAAEQLRMDYAPVDFDGVEYWYR